ncbi:MAG: phosphatase PAP2 family protein [Clostridia bacterium]|nr:phosphatase PAP2 family protein [Clostridia bacterium]
MLGAFLLWTIAVCSIDVQPIGPQGSKVGFATINDFVHRCTGVHLSLYAATDWLSLIPLGIVMGFGLLGLMQWIKRKHILKVDFNILVLGGFYLVVMAAFFCFEVLAVNYRPILIDGQLEASYPSSTTMLVMCVMPTSILQFNNRIKKPLARRCVIFASVAFLIFMVLGRLISGVHWLTDIIGGALLSTALVELYYSINGNFS